MGGLDAVADRLTYWASFARLSNLPDSARPHVLVITKGDATANVTQSLLEWDDFRYRVLQDKGVDVLQNFASVKIIQLAGAHLSSLTRYRGLREIIWKALDEARRVRAGSAMLYSANHQAVLFQDAVRHVARTITEPFNAIVATRRGNEVLPDCSTSLEIFFSLAVKSKVLYDSVAYFVASSILVDAYPPQMHRE